MNINDVSWEAELDLKLVESSFNKAIESKKLFRYQFKNAPSFVNLFEKEIRDYVGTDFALGVSSATSAIFLALKATGVTSSSKVLIPAFTFTAVPSAVMQCGAEPVLVDITENYVIDFDDLEAKIISSGAKYLLLSHMRGHVCNMDKVISICKQYSISLIEDAAHALGVKWKDKHAGTFGLAGIYSLQSYKIINAGEGGVLVTEDPNIFWKSVFMSGSYENNYLLHSSEQLDIASQYKNKLPVFNLRMSNITASIATPQVECIESTIKKLNDNYNQLIILLSNNKSISFVPESDSIRPVRDSIQIRILIDEAKRSKLHSKLNSFKIPISYFGGLNNTNARLYKNWQFINTNKYPLQNTVRNLSEVFDLRLPIHFTPEIIEIIAKELLKIIDGI